MVNGSGYHCTVTVKYNLDDIAFCVYLKRRWWTTVEAFGIDTDESQAMVEEGDELVEYEGLAESVQYISELEASEGAVPRLEDEILRHL